MDRGFIDLTIVSAADIKRGSLFGADKKIVVAWVDPKNKHCTKAAEGDGSKPEWNYKLMLPLANGVRTLTIEIRSKGSFGETLLGTVHIPVADLALDGSKGANKKLTYLVERPSGKKHGSLSVFAKIVKSQTFSNPLANSPVIVPSLERISHHTPSQVNLASAPVLYPPVESYRPEQYRAEQPYPPAESIYPPPYPPSEPALDYMRPSYPPYESFSDRPTSWSYAEHSFAASSHDGHRPILYPPPDRNDYSASAFPSPGPYAYAPTVYPPAGPEYSTTAYPPAVSYYPPTQFHNSQHQVCAPRYPPVCGTYPYPHSCSN